MFGKVFYMTVSLLLFKCTCQHSILFDFCYFNTRIQHDVVLICISLSIRNEGEYMHTYTYIYVYPLAAVSVLFINCLFMSSEHSSIEDVVFSLLLQMPSLQMNDQRNDHQYFCSASCLSQALSRQRSHRFKLSDKHPVLMESVSQLGRKTLNNPCDVLDGVCAQELIERKWLEWVSPEDSENVPLKRRRKGGRKSVVILRECLKKTLCP